MLLCSSASLALQSPSLYEFIFLCKGQEENGFVLFVSQNGDEKTVFVPEQYMGLLGTEKEDLLL